MISFTVIVVDRLSTVKQAADKAAYKNFRHAAASIRKTAIASIKTATVAPAVVVRSKIRRNAKGRFLKGSGKRVVRKGKLIPSPPGSPPHTRRGQLRRAIVFAATNDSAVIGPRYSVVGHAAEAHEFGGRINRNKYPERPTMGPALNRNLARFASDWAGTI